MAGLRELVADWDQADRVLDELRGKSDRYGEIVEVAAQFFCDEDGAESRGLDERSGAAGPRSDAERRGDVIDALARFLIRELDVAPGIAGLLYATMTRPPRFRVHRFLELARVARDPAAARWIRPAARWGETALALDAHALADMLVANVASVDAEPDVFVAAGYFGGPRARDALLALPVTDAIAVGIAIVGDPADLDFFKQLGTQGDGISAKRIHSALAKRHKERLAAIDSLPKVVSIATLVTLAKLLSDAHPEIVERAALQLRTHGAASHVFHAIFLARAAEAIARGVTQAARDALDAIQATIPRSAKLPDGPPAKLVPERPAAARGKPNAKLRGLEMLDTLRAQVSPKPATARNLELEAVIAEDPNDVARYLVYADWLQSQNDARGLLVTLHQATHERPGDKARAVAAKAFLDEHRQSLLGPLDPYVRERDLASVDLEWFMGFIKRARIGSESTKLVLDIVGCLLESPSAPFLQELVIESHGGPLPVDPRRIVERLLATKRPQTLRTISIGKPGAWKPPTELLEAFPGLARDPPRAWADVIVKAAEQSRLKIDVDPAALPQLVPLYPDLEVDLHTILLGLKAELDKQRQLGLLDVMVTVFDRASLDAFAVALAGEWERLAENPRWPFDALGPLGGERAVAWIGRRLAGWSYTRSAQAIDHLVRIGSDAAIYEIITLALTPGGGARRRDAIGALDVVAKMRGLADRDTVLDRVVPATGGERARATQRAWLEYLVLGGHRIPLDDFRGHVAGSALRLPLLTSLLWAECAGDRLLGMFRLDGDGAFVRANGAPYVLQADDSAIGLVHPAELDSEELPRIRAVFREQSILQLERQVHWLSAADANTTSLTRFARQSVGFYALQGVLEARGWLRDEDDDYEGQGTRGWVKYLPRDRVHAYAELNQASSAIGEVRLRGYGELRFDELHVVSISEVLWDLELAHAS